LILLARELLLPCYGYQFSFDVHSADIVIVPCLPVKHCGCLLFQTNKSITLKRSACSLTPPAMLLAQHYAIHRLLEIGNFSFMKIRLE